MKKLILFAVLALITCSFFAFNYNSSESEEETQTSVLAESNIGEFSSVFFSKKDLVDFLENYDANTVFFEPFVQDGKTNIYVNTKPINENKHSESETFQYEFEHLESSLIGEASYDELHDNGLNAVEFESVFYERKELERLLKAPGCKGITFYPVTIDYGTQGIYTGVFKSLKAESVFDDGVVVPLTDRLNIYMSLGPNCPPSSKKAKLFH